MAAKLAHDVTVGNAAFEFPMRRERSVEMVHVTPEIAQHWLSFNVSNREITQSKLDAFSEEMLSGNWAFQGDSIRFSEGKLLDGQHRLLAVLKTGTKQLMLVITGLPPETQANMDTGRGRTPRDILSIEGLNAWESRSLGSAIHIIMAVEEGSPLYSTKKYLNREVRNFYLENRATLERSVMACKVFPRKPQLLPSATLIALHYVFSRVNPVQADDFLSRLTTGENIKGDSPIFFLNKRLTKDLIDKRRRSSFEILYGVVKAWNSYRRGTSIKTESFLYPRPDESFPEVQ